MVTWKICIDNPFLNCEKIYPLQQKKIRVLLDELSQNNNIKKIIIFGSSVTESCHIDSDVDIYVECEKKQSRLIQKYIPFSYDLWTNFTVDEFLLKEILKKGVVIYDATK